MTATKPESHLQAKTIARLNNAMGPIAAGVIIDMIDIITFGPVGLVLGVPIGAAAGYWLGQSMNLRTNQCLMCALAAGIYCTIPFTELLPLGTLVGAIVRFNESGRGMNGENHYAESIVDTCNQTLPQGEPKDFETGPLS